MITARKEHGYTMVELIVTLAIIGLLAAIAIPSFLGQREKGYRASLVSDLRGVQLAQSARAVDGAPRYTDDLAELRNQGYARSPGVSEAYIEIFDGESEKEYVACVKHDRIDDWLVYDSVSGRTSYSPTRCEAP